MSTAFQSGAFQSGAFQIESGSGGHGHWYQRKKAQRKLVRYIEARKIAEEVGLEIHKKRLANAVKPFLAETPKVEQMGALLQNKVAKNKLERILLEIRKLELEMAEILTVLLLTNEEACGRI